MDLTEPAIIELPTNHDSRGSLSVLQTSQAIPFDIARCYWTYDVPADAERNGRAMMSQSEVLVALSGSCDIVTRTAAGVRKFTLDRPFRGMYLPPMTWREIENCTSGVTILTVASGLYDENDYIRDPQMFQEIINSKMS